MELDTDYWHSFDKRAAEHLQISPSYIGISTPPMKSQLEGLKSRIFQGATHVELGFFGAGKGSMAQGATTPEMYGKEEREALRQLAKINEVNLTTHTSPRIPSLSGLAQNQFRDEVAEQALNEVKRTVDFAADVAQGGPVVVHPGEYPRPVSTYKKEGFEHYPGEEEKAPIYLVDDRTGTIQTLPRNQEIPRPVTDEFGNKILDENGIPKFQMRTVKEIENELLQQGTSKEEVGKKIIEEFRKENEEYYDAESRRWASHAQEARKELNFFDSSFKSIKEQEKINPEAAKYSAITAIEHMRGAPRPGTKEYKEFLDNPIKTLEKVKSEFERQISFNQEAASSYARRLQMIQQEAKHTQSIDEYAINKSADTLARAAIYAYDQERSRNLKKTLFIAPENVFPEDGYSSHPQELKELIEKSRKTMAEKLEKERRMSGEQANKIASDHIKATFDIGHAYTWRKFFKGSDKEFNDWLGKQVSDLAKRGIIGHVHLSDNFGYYDEHVTPGEGKVDFQDFIKRMREAGYDKPMIVEPGHQDVQAMTGAWRYFQSPMYRVDSASVSWTDIEGSYFGQTRSPSYVIGSYAPDYGAPEAHRTWRFWSEVPLE